MCDFPVNIELFGSYHIKSFMVISVYRYFYHEHI